jgi:hypothetical protein
LVLGSRLIQEISFDIEKSVYWPSTKNNFNDPVFIMGLARSGTTSLLRVLFETEAFNSLTYREMPFVLMPNTWGKISHPFYQTSDLKERSHGDGILVGYDSPESFEEVFWKMVGESSYIRENSIEIYEPSSNTLDEFRKYICLVSNKLDLGKRYLSKNNNNLVRLKALSEAMPDGKFLVLWRNPFETANSLWRMHQRFSKAQQVDSFVLQYMNFIGHHEFGLGHKPFKFEDPLVSSYSTDNQNYWMEYWIYVYSNFLRNNWSNNVILISYEDICNPDQKLLNTLMRELKVSSNQLNRFVLRASTCSDLPKFDDYLSEIAMTISKNLANSSIT